MPPVQIQSKIHNIRGVEVMLDSDIASLYQVETRVLNQSVKRNFDRFPPDLMFQLTQDEVSNLKSQIVTSSWGGIRKLPFVFTEQGVYMLATVINSPIAVETTKAIRLLEEMVLSIKSAKEVEKIGFV